MPPHHTKVRDLNYVTVIMSESTKSNAPRWPPRQRRLAATGHSLTAACMRRCAGQRRFSRGLAVRGGPGSAALSPGRRMTRFRWSAPWVKDQAAGSADRRGEYAEKFFGTHDLTAADSRTYRATLQVRLGAFRSRERHGAVRETAGDGRRARSGAGQRSARAPEATWVPAGGGSQEQSLHGRPHRRRSASGYPDVRYCRDEALPPWRSPRARRRSGGPPPQSGHAPVRYPVDVAVSSHNARSG